MSASAREREREREKERERESEAEKRGDDGKGGHGEVLVSSDAATLNQLVEAQASNAEKVRKSLDKMAAAFNEKSDDKEKEREEVEDMAKKESTS